MSSIANSISEVLNEILDEDDLLAPDWDDSTVLLETGIDSLGFAVAVSRLEAKLGFDPFSALEVGVYPRTYGDFVKVYENHLPN